jgi:hypothetical protein
MKIAVDLLDDVEVARAVQKPIGPLGGSDDACILEGLKLAAHRLPGNAGHVGDRQGADPSPLPVGCVIGDTRLPGARRRGDEQRQIDVVTLSVATHDHAGSGEEPEYARQYSVSIIDLTTGSNTNLVH